MIEKNQDDLPNGILATRSLFGGLLMGFGGVTALGCSVGQGLSGISTASLSSVIAVLAIAAGGYGMMWLRVSRTEAAIAPGASWVQLNS